MTIVCVSGSFDNLRSRQMRFLQEASRVGEVHIYLWSDDLVRAFERREPKFPQNERMYFLDAVRYIGKVFLVETLPDPDMLPEMPDHKAATWVVGEAEDHPARREFCRSNQIGYHVIGNAQLEGFPLPSTAPASGNRKKALVTGCYDWLHSGHVRFFEEVSQLGDLYVVVGNDANVRHLKGEGHPLFEQAERRYMVQSIRYVQEALVSSGWGWMDAEPEIDRLHPEIYAVNEDGDRPEKRAFCQAHGLDYVVLKRQPKAGLPRRESTHLRGF